MKTPKQIKEYLDLYVIGQDRAKKALSVAAYNHYKRITIGGKLKKSNVLMVGPTGSGKTYMVSILADLFRVKFLPLDATQFTSSGYVGRDVEDIVVELMNLCQKNEEQASKSIIYIDEIDKIRKKVNNSGSADVNGAEVQQAFLKLLEGSDVSYASTGSKTDPHDKKLSTKNIMFICSGAFVDLQSTSTADLIKFGMIPEFLGRFSVVTSLDPLSREDMKKILTDSKGSILHSFTEWFKSEGILLEVKESGLDAIVEKALEKHLGARGLQGVIDEALLNAQFEAPSFTTKPKKFIIDDEVVKTGVPKWEY